MRKSFLIFFLTTFFYGFSQDSIAIRSIDTLLPFFGNSPIDLHPYENRVVPQNSAYPLHVLISYKDGKAKHFEYFRIDSSRYLVYQFFRSGKGSSNKGLKSSGVVHVIDKIVDSAVSYELSSTRVSLKHLLYFKGFSKEGVWKEYDDSLFHYKFWTGKYAANIKVGMWSNYIHDPNGDRLVMEIDYDKDSTVKLFTTNLAGNSPLDSIKFFLNGRWTLACEDDRDRRMLMRKCKLYDGHYGDNCDNRFGKENYYEFFDNGDFKRHKGETCNNFRQSATTGKWRPYRIKDDLFLEIKLANGAVIKYIIWYLDREGNMVADRL